MTQDPDQAAKRWRRSWQAVTLGWCLWLLVAWGLTLASSAVVPATRWMVYAAMIGAMAAWPTFRLSQSPFPPGDARSPRAAWALIFGDWVSLVVLLQLMIWPLWLSTGQWQTTGAGRVFVMRWSWEQTGLLSAALSSWMLLTAAIVAWGVGRGTRAAAWLAMVACVALIVGEPIVQGVAGAIGGTNLDWPAFRVSPLSTLWGLTESKAAYRPEPWTARVIAVAAAGVIAWAGLWAMGRRRVGR